MKQRFLSIFTVVALMASVIAGAMGVSLNHAKADPQSYYLDDIKNLIVSQTGSSASIDSFFAAANNYIDMGVVNNLQYFVMGLYDPNTSGWMISIYSSPTQYGTNWYSYALNNINGINRDPSNSYDRGSVTCIDNLMVLGSDYNFRVTGTFTMHFSGAHRFNTTTFNGSNGWRQPCPSSYNTDAGYTIFSSVDIIPGSGTWGMGKNLFGGSAPPTIYTFELMVFFLGEKKYLTITDQQHMYQMEEDKDDSALFISSLNPDLDMNADLIGLSDENQILIPAPFSLNGLTNVSPMGIYAFDITNLNWESIEFAKVYGSDGYGLQGECSNVPISLVENTPGENGNPDSYTQSFSTFYEYTNNYNTTHVIPETLAETLFGVEGGKLYPVTVSEPSSVAATRNDGALVDGNLFTFKWSMTEPNDLGYNYELFDVVIIPSNYAGYYGLVYFYDSSLNPPYQFVDRVSFDSLLDSFDCIIILPDDAGTLEDNTWWQQLVPSFMHGDMAVGGTSSKGIEYADTVSGNEFQGFMIVTKKAIHKQQLFVFNDGITKTYKLMSDYIEKRGDWEDSFLAWTASLFSQWQTLDGKLGSIYNLLYGWNLSSVLSDISESLARIANNTSEEDPGYWFLSLFNWLNRFSVTDSDFANWVSEYDDFTDDLPDPGSGATVIPFPTAIPTVAVGG